MLERDVLRSQLQGVNSERMRRELADVLEALSAEQPLVLILEDLHWCDPSTVEALALLARRTQAAKLLLIGSYRAADLIVHEHPLKTTKHELQSHRQCHEIALGYLHQSAVAAYLEQRFSVSSTHALAARVHQRTEGQPLYMVALADYLAESNALAEHAGDELELLHGALPVRLKDFIELQIGRLSSSEQHLWKRPVQWERRLP